jgi:site-specific DNA-cytosine methylase
MLADIRLVGSIELEGFMPIHVVTVSSPCQGLSRANRNGRGLADPQSELIGNAFQILTYLSRHQDITPAYTFEIVDATTPAKTPGMALQSSIEWRRELSARPSLSKRPS